MATSNADLWKWQQDFRIAPKVWLTFCRYEGTEEWTGNAYSSEEAAQREIAFYEGKKYERYSVRGVNLHDLDLSTRRWRRKPNA